MSDTDILRRIAERGLKLAQDTDPKFIDIFQHLLDEIQRMTLQHQEALGGQQQLVTVPETALEGELLPPESTLHRQARELLEELQSKETANSGASGSM